MGLMSGIIIVNLGLFLGMLSDLSGRLIGAIGLSIDGTMG